MIFQYCFTVWQHNLDCFHLFCKTYGFFDLFGIGLNEVARLDHVEANELGYFFDVAVVGVFFGQEVQVEGRPVVSLYLGRCNLETVGRMRDVSC